MYIDAYISHIPLESLSSRSSHTQLQAWGKGLEKGADTGKVQSRACNWARDEWVDRDSKGIWEIYIFINIHIECTFADTSVCVCYACHLPSHHIKEAAFGRLHRGGRPPSAAAPRCGLLYMVAGKVASIAKTYRRISKCAMNMYIDAYISHIPSESLSSQSSHTHLQACYSRQGIDIIQTKSIY